jgi:hypothetical protein
MKTMSDTKNKLVFVYNADSGMFNTLKDITHKIVSPETYECNLCSITHGNFSMHSEWKSFINEIDFPVLFLHRNEAREQYGVTDQLPAVYMESPEGLELRLDAKAINSCESIEELKEMLLESVSV